MNRESIYSALFSLISNIDGVRTSSRRLKLYSEVPDRDCPAIFQNQTGETTTQLRGQPKIVTLTCDWYVYLNTSGDHNEIQSTQINEILSSIDSIFTPDIMTGTFTLGGIVSHCWIEGQTKIIEGVIGDYSIAIIPITIKTSEVI